MELEKFKLKLKSDYFRIEMATLGTASMEYKGLKSDYFRIEISLSTLRKKRKRWLKSDYFRIEIILHRR